MTCRWLRWHLQPLAQSSAREFGGALKWWGQQALHTPHAGRCLSSRRWPSHPAWLRVAVGRLLQPLQLLRGALQMLEQPWVGEGLVQVCRGAVWRQPPAGGGCASTSSLSSLSCLPVAQCWAAPHKLFANQIIIIEHFASGLLTGSSQNICKSGT